MRIALAVMGLVLVTVSAIIMGTMSADARRTGQVDTAMGRVWFVLWAIGSGGCIWAAVP